MAGKPFEFNFLGVRIEKDVSKEDADFCFQMFVLNWPILECVIDRQNEYWAVWLLNIFGVDSTGFRHVWEPVGSLTPKGKQIAQMLIAEWEANGLVVHTK